MPSCNEDFYALLGVPPDASTDTVRRAYRSQMRRHHPDMHPEHERQRAHEKAAKLTIAWDVLSDPIKRRDYDANRNWTAPSPAPPAQRDPRAPGPPPAGPTSTLAEPERVCPERRTIVRPFALALALLAILGVTLAGHVFASHPSSAASGEYCSVASDGGQMLSFYPTMPHTTSSASSTELWSIMVPSPGDSFIAWWTPEFPYWERANQTDGFTANGHSYSRFQYVEVLPVWEEPWEPLSVVFENHPSLTGKLAAEATERWLFTAKWIKELGSPQCL